MFPLWCKTSYKNGGKMTCLGCEMSYKNEGERSHIEVRNVLTWRGERKVFPGGGGKRLNGGETSHIGGETSHIRGETSHIGGKTSFVGAKHLTEGRNVLNWGNSSWRRNVLKMGVKRLRGRIVYGAKCP